ncbi:MAG TPA: Dabb family protein [Candidatus Butyricicoccus stercorigallinarum]|nr:Dabb family protein [Candidatus Butyricicoccus stercorigallinarum]
MITHIVMWKFREGEQENMHRFLDGLRALDGVIPQIRSMQVRVSCNEANAYDAVLISKFDSLDDLERYKNDPRHVAVSQLCKSIRETRAAIDFEE